MRGKREVDAAGREAMSPGRRRHIDAGECDVHARFLVPHGGVPHASYPRPTPKNLLVRVVQGGGFRFLEHCAIDPDGE